MKSNYRWPCFKTKDTAKNNAYQSAFDKFKRKCKKLEPHTFNDKYRHEKWESSEIGCSCGLTTAVKVTISSWDFNVIVTTYAGICENCGED